MTDNISYSTLLMNLIKKAQYKVIITFLLHYITVSDLSASQQSLVTHCAKLKQEKEKLAVNKTKFINIFLK